MKKYNDDADRYYRNCAEQSQQAKTIDISAAIRNIVNKYQQNAPRFFDKSLV